jgi:hypothetical protein
VGRIWVLDTETKGTGAEMVPLDKVLRKRPVEPLPVHVPPPRRPRPEPPPEPEPPRRFKVVDVMTREAIAEDTSARATVDALRDVRSLVDVQISVWEPRRSAWRLLTLGEQRMLWALRDDSAGAGTGR